MKNIRRLLLSALVLAITATGMIHPANAYQTRKVSAPAAQKEVS